MNATRTSIVAVISLTQLWACGGGGGDDSNPDLSATGGTTSTTSTVHATTGGSLGQGGVRATVSSGGAVSTTGGATSTATSGAAGSATSSTGSTSLGGTSSTTSSATTGGGKSLGGASSAAGASASGGITSVGGTTSKGGTTSSGGTVSSTVAGTDPCAAPPAPSDLVGWASLPGNGVPTTTGGGTVAPVTVTTLAALKTAVAGTTPAVIYVKGILDSGVITVGSNKTLVGLCGAELHGHLELSGSTNVIIRNIAIVGYAVGDCSKDPTYNAGVGCSSGMDAISVQNNAHHIWFDHCDISDGTDGNLDITKGADYVTVSYTKFHYTARTDLVGSDSTGTAGHRFSNLVGGSNTEASTGKLNITWHHNWWANLVHERQPQIRFGKNHLFNNLWTSSGNNYCVRAAFDAHILLESNVFSGVKSPHLFYTGATADSNITADATNTYTGTSGTKTTGGSGAAYTSAGYPYTPDAADQVQARVTAEAGPK